MNRFIGASLTASLRLLCLRRRLCLRRLGCVPRLWWLRRLWCAPLLWVATAVIAAPAADAINRHCLSMSHIDQIEVIDDSTLIFHMRGKKHYINRLPYRCPGLKNNSFLHETSLHNYCDLDTITVLDTHLGMRLGSCPLGKFEPYAPEDNRHQD